MAGLTENKTKPSSWDLAELGKRGKKRKTNNNNKKDDQKKSILIPLKFMGKPFLGLAQLSKIF